MNVFMYQAALFCPDCAVSIKEGIAENEPDNVPADPNDEYSFDSDTYPKGPFCDGGGESDSPQHCDECHTFLENPLTTDGYDYLKSMIVDYISSRKGNGKLIKEWIDFYDITLNDLV